MATILTAYKIPAAERAEVIEEAKAEHASGWWDRPLPGVPTEMGTLASYESDANSLTDWSVSLVPGLLQTEDYAMALMLSQDWLARRRRQKIVGTVDYGAYISEAALRTPFGGPDGHRKQIKHLLDARERGIPVRVVPEHLPTGLISHSWRKSSFSGDGGSCVQVRQDLAAVRDSKNPISDTLAVQLTGLVAAIKGGKLGGSVVSLVER